MTERVRWQLDGWLSGTVGGGADEGRPTAGVSVLRLVALEVVDTGRQLGLWGEENGGQQQVERAVDRVLGLLGPTAVITSDSTYGANKMVRSAERPRNRRFTSSARDSPSGSCTTKDSTTKIRLWEMAPRNTLSVRART